MRAHPPPAAGAVPAARRLAAHACALDFADLPAGTVAAAETCLIDAVACAIFGSALPWSRLLAETVGTGGGPCRFPGFPAEGLEPTAAALVLGAWCHAFELDSLRKPGIGVHPGATVALPALAVAQAVGASGRDLIRAIVAGCEVSFRLGLASHHRFESRGFHAPGITGPLGAGVAAALLMGADEGQMVATMGLAASFAGGLLAFSAAGHGGMVKRLHLGRAAEGGVLAARLARAGYEAPDTALDGRFGVLDAFCDGAEPDLLTRGLGEEPHAIRRLCLKRYAAHVTAQAPIELLREMMDRHGFGPGQIARIRLAVGDKVLSHHAGTAPADISLAQYSVPFALAISAFGDPDDPALFAGETWRRAEVRDLAQRIQLTRREGGGWGAGMAVVLADGRVFEGTREDFLGCPERPLDRAALRSRFLRLAAALGPQRAAALFDRLAGVAAEPRLDGPFPGDP